MFDPWTTTVEQVEAEQDKWEESGGRVDDPCGPIYQATGACKVLDLKEAIDGGDGFSVLAAIRICVTNGLVAPEWLAYAFNRRYDAVLNYRAKSWDDPLSFGRPYPKGANLVARRKARAGQLAVWLSVVTRLKADPDTPIDKGLFEDIGRPLGFGATLAEEYYYEQKRLHKRLFGNDSALDKMSPAPAKIRKAAGLRKKQS